MDWMDWNDERDEFDELEDLRECGALDEHRERKHEELMKALVKPTGKKLDIITTTNMEKKLKEAKKKERQIKTGEIKARDRKRKAGLIRKYRRLLKEVKELEK